MGDQRHLPAGDDPSTVLAGEVGRLQRELSDLRSTALARAGGASGFRVYRSSSVALSAATLTKIIFNAETVDQRDEYDTATGTWTVAETRWYDVAAYLLFLGAGTAERLIVALYVNGSESVRLHDGGNGAPSSPAVGGSAPLYLTAGDEVSVYGSRDLAGNVGGSAIYSNFTAKG